MVDKNSIIGYFLVAGSVFYFIKNFVFKETEKEENKINVKNNVKNNVENNSKKRFIKGSEEAKQYMSNIRKKRRNKTAKKTVKNEDFVKKSQKKETKDYKMSKAEAGKLGGIATKNLGEHKGHKTKKGLVIDSKNLGSKQKHEQRYLKDKTKN